MPRKRDCPNHGPWNVATLHAHIERQLDDLRTLIDERAAGQAAAIVETRRSLDSRFDSVNEFREALADQTRQFVTRAEADTQHQTFTAAIAALNAQVLTLVSREEYTAAHQRVVDTVDAQATRLDRSEGRGAGLNAGWVYLLSAIAALGTLVSLALAFHFGVA